MKKIFFVGVLLFLCINAYSQGMDLSNPYIDPATVADKDYLDAVALSSGTVLPLDGSRAMTDTLYGTSVTLSGNGTLDGLKHTMFSGGHGYLQFNQEGYIIDYTNMVLGAKLTNYFIYGNATNTWDAGGTLMADTKVESQVFRHSDDVNTELYFTDDYGRLTTGGLSVIEGDENGTDIITLGGSNWDYMYTGYGAFIDTRAWSTGDRDFSGSIKSRGDITGMENVSRVVISSIVSAGAKGLFLTDKDGVGIFVEDGGNVGIGTSNPTVKLEVNGKYLSNTAAVDTINVPNGQIKTKWLNVSSTSSFEQRVHSGFGLLHLNDTDTEIFFSDDLIQFQAGSLQFLVGTEATIDSIEIGSDDWDTLTIGTVIGNKVSTYTYSSGDWDFPGDVTIAGDLTFSGDVIASSQPRAYFAYSLEGSSVYVNTADVYSVLMGTGTLIEDNKESEWFYAAVDINGNLNRITYGGPNTHQMKIILTASFVDTEAGVMILHCSVTKNGTIIPLAEQDGTSTVQSDDIDIPIVCHTEMTTGDYIEIKYRTDGDNPAVDHAQISITVIG